MKFLIVDPDLYERIKDDPGVILAWDEAQIAAAAHSTDRWLGRRRHKRFLIDLARALETVKRELFAL